MKRGRDPHDDPRSGPSKNQLRGLTFTAQQPAFLRNAMAALSGQRSSAPGTNGRPAIPTRPEGLEEDEPEPESDPDEWDLGRGDEAPAVVVLKEGKHIDRDEVDRLRAQAKDDASGDPFASSATTDSSAKNKGSLSFSSGSSSKFKAARGGGGTGDWADVVKQSKGDSEVKSSKAGAAKEAAGKTDAPARTAEEEAKDKEKEAKRKAKEKKAAKKKIAMLSFDDE